MELANVSSSFCLYATAPACPNPYEHGKSAVAYLYCSAPVSPGRKEQEKSDFPKSNFIDFEFVGRRQRCRERGDSLPSMAFRDELFFSGLVMPLKLPPRLQCNGVFSRSSQRLTFAPSSKSPTTTCRIPFACKHTWNDDFDPFAVALEKVREEKRGRASARPRRSRSYSPLRLASKYSCTDTVSCNQDSFKDKSSMKSTNQVPVLSYSGPLELKGTVSCNQDSFKDKSLMKSTNQVQVLSYSGPLELKGSAYARWIRDQKKQGLNLRGPKNPTEVRVNPMKKENDGMDRPRGRDAKDECGNDRGESRVQKLKGLLFKYASLGREKNVAKLTKKSVQAQKGSYLSRLSFKFRETGKRMPDDETTTTAADYKPSIIACKDYQMGKT